MIPAMNLTKSIPCSYVLFGILILLQVCFASLAILTIVYAFEVKNAPEVVEATKLDDIVIDDATTKSMEIQASRNINVNETVGSICVRNITDEELNPRVDRILELKVQAEMEQFRSKVQNAEQTVQSLVHNITSVTNSVSYIQSTPPEICPENNEDWMDAKTAEVINTQSDMLKLQGDIDSFLNSWGDVIAEVDYAETALLEDQKQMEKRLVDYRIEEVEPATLGAQQISKELIIMGDKLLEIEQKFGETADKFAEIAGTEYGHLD